MHSAVEQMLKNYNIATPVGMRNAAKEVVQELALCAMYKAGFFKKAAFYGGTALRIFYGLNRFSEDLDFSLEEADENFDFDSYFPALENEINAFGLNFSVEKKVKSKESDILSAFLKGSTREHFLLFYADSKETEHIAKNEVIKIKFEVDVTPPKYAVFEHKYRLLPLPYEINMYNMPSLFAGKIHAVIYRAWQNRVKGRDLYDYVFYLSRGASVNLRHLRERLIQTGHLKREDEFSIEYVKALLEEKFNSVDFKQAKRDVIPFIRDASELDLWCPDFFKQITAGLTGDKDCS